MSSLVFPSLPGRQMDWTREPFAKDDIFETPSGVEQRSSRQSQVRYRYSLTYRVRKTVNAPGTYGGQTLSERDVIDYFFMAHRRWDSFLFTDPWDGMQVRVRFDDSPSFRQVVPGWFDVDVEFVSVIG